MLSWWSGLIAAPADGSHLIELLALPALLLVTMFGTAALVELFQHADVSIGLHRG